MQKVPPLLEICYHVKRDKVSDTEIATRQRRGIIRADDRSTRFVKENF